MPKPTPEDSAVWRNTRYGTLHSWKALLSVVRKHYVSFPAGDLSNHAALALYFYPYLLSALILEVGSCRFALSQLVIEEALGQQGVECRAAMVMSDLCANSSQIANDPKCD